MNEKELKEFSVLVSRMFCEYGSGWMGPFLITVGCGFVNDNDSESSFVERREYALKMVNVAFNDMQVVRD